MNGKTERDFLNLVPGGTLDDANYIAGWSYNTCGNRKMLLNDPTHPILANLNASVISTPKDLGNKVFCCEVQIAGTITYKPCGCCSPRTEYVFDQFCISCASDVAPTITLGSVVCNPEPIHYYNGCCQQTALLTNKIAITTSLNVVTPASSI